ncbi:MAG: LamG domain-containing protein [Phycisphaerae bacterium]|nr:LamG domain-containing protein [Phycisphaerae bacterium]
MNVRTTGKLFGLLIRPTMAICAVLLFCVVAMAEDTPAEVFKSIYSRKIWQAKDTSVPDDDLKLAKEMLKDASANELPDELRVLMYNAVYDLAARWRAGHSTAYSAMDRLARSVPAQTNHAWRKRLELLLKRLRMARSTSQKQTAARSYVGALRAASDAFARSGTYGTASLYIRKALALAVEYRMSGVPEIRRKMARCAALLKVSQKRGVIEKKLKAAPGDIKVREQLIYLYLIDLNDPGAASKILNDDCDELLRTYVTLAGKPLDKLETIAIKELGTWYGRLADRASVSSKPAMLRRGEACWVRYLEVYTKKDTTRIKAGLALAMVRRELKKLGVGPSRGDGASLPVAISTGWPCSTSDLLFVWWDASASNAVPRVGSLPARECKPVARGGARITTSGAMEVGKGAFVAGSAINDRVFSVCKRSNALTVEAMIRPDDLKQKGPARIISFSQDGQDRDFTVGQEKDKLVFRLRTVSSKDQNNTIELFDLSARQWHHVVITYAVSKGSSSKKSVGMLDAYLNGRRTSRKMLSSGLLSGWKPMHLIFGDEYAASRDWSGQLQGIAIYGRAISASEIAAKHRAVKPTLDARNRRESTLQTPGGEGRRDRRRKEKQKDR